MRLRLAYSNANAVEPEQPKTKSSPLPRSAAKLPPIATKAARLSRIDPRCGVVIEKIIDDCLRRREQKGGA